MTPKPSTNSMNNTFVLKNAEEKDHVISDDKRGLKNEFLNIPSSDANKQNFYEVTVELFCGV